MGGSRGKIWRPLQKIRAWRGGMKATCHKFDFLSNIFYYFFIKLQ